MVVSVIQNPQMIMQQDQKCFPGITRWNALQKRPGFNKVIEKEIGIKKIIFYNN
jgi:hypothetical protein